VQVLDLFPTPIYLDKCQFDLTTEIEFLENSVMHVDGPKEHYGSRSEDTYILNNDELSDLRNWIIDCIQSYVINVLCLNVEYMGLSQSWVSKKDANQKHIPHKHPNSLISGVFYWQKDISPIVFVNEQTKFNFDVETFDTNREWDLTGSEVELQPIENGLVLFPSNLAHYVPTNDSEKSRYSLAFNSVPLHIGSMGNLTELDFSKIYGKS
jgi:uncharacterized protein (TIGR02466 family)